MKIFIKNLIFEAIIGILQSERVTPQRVCFDLKISYKYKNNFFINYIDICEYITQDVQQKKYLLLEDALKKISKNLKKKYPQILKLSISVSKPDILQNATVGAILKVSYKKN
ncbi:MAG: dihydroneopterin aldolase [Sulfurospirillaceae bacterium]|nr:dihydroneopterin aldolase [Sulfurospirillaceae bacterium]